MYWTASVRLTERAACTTSGVPAVMGHRAETVYELTVEEVQSVCRKNEHALDEVSRPDGESIRQIADWHPDFAFT